MEDFRRQFSSEYLEKLENLYQEIQNAATLSDAVKNEALRVLHTVKGTAQTFGLTVTSRLAHDVETRISDGEITRRQLSEDIRFLQKSLTETPFQTPDQSAKNITEQSLRELPSDDNWVEMPFEIYSRLSNRERKIVGTAIRDGKHLTVSEVDFDRANFAAELIAFRMKMSFFGEIIATFPGANDDGNRISFRFLTSSSKKIEVSEEFPVKFSWRFSPPNTGNIGTVLREIVRHGTEIAAALDKRIEIETQTDEMKFSGDELKTVFEILLHLVRNAVDHAFDKNGKIKIRIEADRTAIRLSVADDGRGVDSERIRTAAVEKNLIAIDENLTATEAMNFIFQPGFSTRTELSEISGRGIGLNAVRRAVENFGGEISLAAETGKGATFSIFLPRKPLQL